MKSSGDKDTHSVFQSLPPKSWPFFEGEFDGTPGNIPLFLRKIPSYLSVSGGFKFPHLDTSEKEGLVPCVFTPTPVKTAEEGKGWRQAKREISETRENANKLWPADSAFLTHSWS